MEFDKLAILHVALNPETGVWSMMRELAKAQAASGIYRAVGLGVISDSRWRTNYFGELERSELVSYLAHTPKMFGTAQFLWQRIKRPPVDEWVDNLLVHSKATQCVVHFHNAWLSGVFLPLSSTARNRSRVVATVHGVNAKFQGQPVRQRLHQWMASQLEQHGAILTSVDRTNLSRAQSLLAMNPEDFWVVPNGVADKSTRGCPSLSGQSTFTLGHVGNMTSAKGWRLLVEAAEILRAEGRDIRVILAGRGEDANSARALAELSGGWLSYEGFVPNPREDLLTKLDVLVLMSEQEGMPMAIIEALSLGVPVVATRVGGIPEVLIHEQNGLLVERSAPALADAIKSLLVQKDKLRKMSLNARHTFESKFEISRVVAQYDQVYRSKS